MSLNWREINLVLEELQLSGAYLREIAQPDYSQLLFLLWIRNQNIVLRISHTPQYCVLHQSAAPFQKPRTPTRLMELLRSRIRNGRILSAYQLSNERIVRIAIQREQVSTILWVRLWSGAANTIVTDTHMVIQDALFRRPHKNEISGAVFEPIRAPCFIDTDRTYTIRSYDTAHYDSFNSWIDSSYRIAAEKLRRTQRIAHVHTIITKSLQRIERQLSDGQRPISSFEHYRMCGQLLLANIAQVPANVEWVTLGTPSAQEEVTIQLDARLNAQQNAQLYFKRYRDAQARHQWKEEQRLHLQDKMKKLKKDLKKLDNPSESELHTLAARYPRSPSDSTPEPRSPARRFQSSDYSIFVGRSARDNDWIMRHIARPHDLWLHARGVPGSTVIIRTMAKKSVPQEILIDAAMLALYYSNERSNGEGEVHYTAVKFVRRPKDGKPGTFIPEREKNLSVIIQEERIACLHKYAPYATLSKTL